MFMIICALFIKLVSLTFDYNSAFGFNARKYNQRSAIAERLWSPGGGPVAFSAIPHKFTRGLTKVKSAWEIKLSTPDFAPWRFTSVLMFCL